MFVIKSNCQLVRIADKKIRQRVDPLRSKPWVFVPHLEMLLLINLSLSVIDLQSWHISLL